MSNNVNKNLLYGIIGGMGPATSAEFLNYIYSESKGRFETERDYPRMILISDSLAPDRLESFRNDNFLVLNKYLEDMIRKLNLFAVDKIMICCLVAHACLKNIDQELRKNIVSITDLLSNKLMQTNKKILLLSTSMLYEMKLINNENTIFINNDEIDKINQFIYKLKITDKQSDFMDFINLVDDLLKKYKSDTVALACSDLHMVNRFIKKNRLNVSFDIIDSMDLAASYILNDTRKI